MLKNFHTLNISLGMSFIPDLSTIKDKVLVKIGEKEYEFTMQSVSCKSNSEPVTDWKNGQNYRVKYYDDFDITGWLVDKKVEAVRIAKEDVRQKQKEFKEAQRKLSELMGDKE